MKSREMHAVFVALLRACEKKLDGKSIVKIAEAAASSNGVGFLMQVADDVYGYVRCFCMLTPPLQLARLLGEI